MARLNFFVEGQTEQTFADTVLKPHLANHGVYMDKPVLIANARKRRRVHRGGGRNFAAMQADIERRLKQEWKDGVFFTSMIDLYALADDFPGIEEAGRYRDDPYRRVEILEACWADRTGDARFIPFIQLHEYETYLFCDLSRLSFFYDDADSKIRTLQEVVDAVESPELIDDGSETVPSKRIIAQFPEYRFTKATVGPQAAELVGLPAIRCKCPHFARWMERLERLGQEVGSHEAIERILERRRDRQALSDDAVRSARHAGRP